MNDRETRRYDMCSHVQTSGKDNASDFAAGSKATGHFATVTHDIRFKALAEGWQSASHIEHAPQRAKKPASSGGTPASPPK